MALRFRFAGFLPVLLALAANTPAAIAQTKQQEPAPKEPSPLPRSTWLDLAYATLGGRPITLDLYLPPDISKPVPLIIYIHGSGWCSDSKRTMPPVLLKVLDLGFAMASVDYRLTSQAGQWGTEPVTFPAQIHDVKGAVRFLRANAARYHLDPGRFAAIGISSGGHLTALLATSGGVAELEGTVGGNLGVSSRIQVGVDYCGPTDMVHLADDVTSISGDWARRLTLGNPIAMLVGCKLRDGESISFKELVNNNAAPCPEIRRLLTLADPIAYVDPGDPPLFIGHATGDTLVPVGQSLRLAAALKKAGVKCELTITQGGGHCNLGFQTHIAALRFVCEAINPAATGMQAVVLQMFAPKK